MMYADVANYTDVGRYESGIDFLLKPGYVVRKDFHARHNAWCIGLSVIFEGNVRKIVSSGPWPVNALHKAAGQTRKRCDNHGAVVSIARTVGHGCADAVEGIVDDQVAIGDELSVIGFPGIGDYRTTQSSEDRHLFRRH